MRSATRPFRLDSRSASVGSRPMPWRTVALALSLCLLATAADSSAPRAVGDFEDHADVGTVARPGAAEYDAAAKTYRVTGGGENVWGKRDAFHFLWRNASGDFTLSADVRFSGEGKNAHRKACLMARQGLEPDAPYVDVAVHGDGLVSLQFRREKGGDTAEVKCATRSPTSVRLRRTGDTFTLLVAQEGEPFEKGGEATVQLGGPVVVGLAVCSHDATVDETAVFANVDYQKVR